VYFIEGDEVLKRIVIAGGSCGNSMMRGAEKIKKTCGARNLQVQVSMHNLWESSAIDPRANLVIQMFPFLRDLPCPLLDGRPFITGKGESELVEKVITILSQGD